MGGVLDQDVQAKHKICCAKHKNQTENDMKMWLERNRRQTSSPSEIPAKYYKQASKKKYVYIYIYTYRNENVGKLENTTNKRKQGKTSKKKFKKN